MVPHFGLQFCSVCAGDDLVRLLERHVANRALIIDPAAQFGKLAAILRLVATKALGSKCLQVALRRMHIMASAAGDRRARLETAASL